MEELIKKWEEYKEWLQLENDKVLEEMGVWAIYHQSQTPSFEGLMNYLTEEK